MPGPPPKDPSARQRRNKKPSAATLDAPVNARVPAIPNPDRRKWHALTKVWWNHIWKSPMSTRFLSTDRDAISRIAVLVDEFWKGDHSLLAEIRLQEARFGLSPWDRAKLDWRVTEEATEDKPRPTSTAKREGADPRSVLRAVK